MPGLDILFLTQIIPYPPDAGPKVKTWHVLRYLSELGHSITLVSFIRPEEEKHVDPLRRICSQVYTIPIHRSRLADVGYWARSNFTGRPFLIERDDMVEMRELVIRLIAQHSIDIIHADQLTMTQFALPSWQAEKSGRKVTIKSDIGSRVNHGWPATIFDAHNAVWTIVERMSDNVPFILKPILSLESRRVKRYEALVIEEFDHTLTVTDTRSGGALKCISFKQQNR